LSWKRALRDIQRRDRAELEGYQQAWMAMRLSQAEAALVALGLPANCWSAMQLRFDADGDHPLQDVGTGIQSGPTVRTLSDGRKETGEWPGKELYAFVAADPRSSQAWEAVRLASIARALDTAMRSDWPSARFAIGRFVERVRLADPIVRGQLLSQFHSRAGRKGGTRKRGTLAVRTAFIRLAVRAAANRSLAAVLDVFRDEAAVDDLLRADPTLPTIDVEVDDEARKVEFSTALDVTSAKAMSFAALQKAIERTPRRRDK
jgi:hypothetical protein